MIHLLRRLLEPNLYKRATIYEVICHPWLKGEGSVITKEEILLAHQALKEHRILTTGIPLRREVSPHISEILKTSNETNNNLDTIVE